MEKNSYNNARGNAWDIADVFYLQGKGKFRQGLSYILILTMKWSLS